jgi:polysaccharide biosynthesis/export protein
MQIKRLSIIFILLAFFAPGHFAFLSPDRDAVCEAQTIRMSPLSSQHAEEYQKLTPQQQQAIQSEMSKSGGALTSEAISALRTRPEFKGLKPEEIIKGMEQLKDREKAAAKKEPFLGEETELEAEKRTIIEEPRKESLFDRARQTGKYQDISLDLKPFGYEFFKEAAVRVLTERVDVPVPLKYVVRPGDEVRILMWGRTNEKYNLIVDRDGKITIPQIGPVDVAGMTYEQMSEHLIKKVEQIVGTNIDISMGATSTIPIFVLGDVKRPGSYTVGSFATITDALLTAGGPSEIGSMRRIELRRKEKLAARLDLYDLFLKGDKSRDMTLQAGDVVFVPVTGPLCGIAGNVKRPAIYELKDKFDLEHLFDLAGGIIPSAYMQQIQVERIVRSEKSIVVDINDKTLDRSKHFVLQDADLVKVFSIVDTDENAVYLDGNVKYPGKYAFKPGMKVKDLIKGPGDLEKETYFDYALIKRESPPSREIVLIPFNLGKLILQDDPSSNIELTPKDHLYVFHKQFFEIVPHITIAGEIRGDCGFDRDFTKNDQKWVDTFDLSQRLNTIGEKLRKGENHILAADVKNMEQKLKKEGTIDLVEIGALRYEMEKIGQTELAEEVQRIEEDLKNEGRNYLALGIKEIEEELKKEGELNKEQQQRREQKFATDSMDIYRLMVQARELYEDFRSNGRIESAKARLFRSELEKVNKQILSDKMKEIEKALEISCRLELFGNMRVKDAILGAGGLTSNASLDRGEIIRKDAKKKFTTIYFNVAKAMAGDPRENLLLQEDDHIVVHSIWESVTTKSVFIDGEIMNPGPYQYTEKMTVRDLVFKAGNILESAYLDEAEIASMETDSGKTAKFVHREINLGRALEGDPLNNVVLQPYDRLLVKKIKDFREVKFADITGEVSFPAKYQLMKGEKLSSLIERAGGYLDTAYLRGAYFIRERVRRTQQEGLTDMADRLERNLLTASDISTAISAEEVAGKKVELEQKKQFVQYLRGVKATGRMTIKLAHLRLLKGSEYDIELEDGDRLFVPAKNNVVNVTGAVMSQGSYVYSSRMDYKDYIDMTGGFSGNADEGNIFVLKVDGSARKAKSGLFNWSSSRNRWEMANFGEDIQTIEPGDTIIVPEKIGKIAWLREVRDIAQIVMNIAVTAGVFKALY